MTLNAVSFMLSTSFIMSKLLADAFRSPFGIDPLLVFCVSSTILMAENAKSTLMKLAN